MSEEEERRHLLTRLRLADAKLVRHHAMVDWTAEELEAPDTDLDFIRRVVANAEDHLNAVIEAEREMRIRPSRPPRRRR